MRIRPMRRMLLALLLVTPLPFLGWAQPGQAAAQSPSERHDDRFVTVGDHFYLPEELTVALGKPVRFHIGNISSDHIHNFLVLDEDGTLVAGPSTVIYPNQRIVFEWTPSKAGTYIIACAVCPVEEEMLALVHVV